MRPYYLLLTCTVYCLTWSLRIATRLFSIVCSSTTSPNSQKSSIHQQVRVNWSKVTGFNDRMDHLENLSSLFANKCVPLFDQKIVGEACQRFHSIYRRSRGMYFSTLDRGQMAAMVHNWPQEHVKLHYHFPSSQPSPPRIDDNMFFLFFFIRSMSSWSQMALVFWALETWAQTECRFPSENCH